MTPHPEAARRILLVEDEESMAEGLLLNLKAEGYVVDLARTGRHAVERFQEATFDLVILDIMLPYMNGFEVAETIRRATPLLPILFLTALSGHESLIRGLSLGGDDYLTKPFHLDELLLRVKGMLRRGSLYRSSGRTPIFLFGGNRIDLNTLSVHAGDRSYVLTDREAEVLRYLVDSRGRTVSRAELLEHVWGLDPKLDTRTIDNFVVRLRKYMERSPARPRHFLTVRGVGYRFEAADLRVEYAEL
ncbi:MAG TPA: response regulator transcription factor [Spirochaetia bacterium]|nr:response regulator transcription factor [Spirochaetia bacterium]